MGAQVLNGRNPSLAPRPAYSGVPFARLPVRVPVDSDGGSCGARGLAPPTLGSRGARVLEARTRVGRPPARGPTRRGTHGVTVGEGGPVSSRLSMARDTGREGGRRRGRPRLRGASGGEADVAMCWRRRRGRDVVASRTAKCTGPSPASWRLALGETQLGP